MKNRILTIVALLIPLVLGVALGFIYYQRQKNIKKEPADAQNQIIYGQETKKLLDQKQFIDKLPYFTDNFDISYSTTDAQIEVIMKNKNMTFKEAKEDDLAAVQTYLKSIGVDLNKEKITWFLRQ